MSQLKVSLKKLNISYARLALKLNIPESTLKKWMNAEDGPFGRIMMICEELGLSLQNILRSIETQDLKTFTFSIEQQKFFLKDPAAFKVYWFLVYERKSPSEIQELLNLKSDEFNRYLLKLDRVHLIEVGKNNQTKLPRMKPVKWKFSGHFMDELFKTWTQGILVDPSKKDLLQFFQLSESSLKEFHKDLEELEEKYARRTILELMERVEKLHQIRYMRVVAEGSFIKNGQL